MHWLALFALWHMEELGVHYCDKSVPGKTFDAKMTWSVPEMEGLSTDRAEWKFWKRFFVFLQKAAAYRDVTEASSCISVNVVNPT